MNQGTIEIKCNQSIILSNIQMWWQGGMFAILNWGIFYAFQELLESASSNDA